ncbi:phosphorylase superfamily protein [Actinidia rufa]|uniref:Phosphorylase superfamily protein n=1 Tax=Actinidia rufa TaxID=165716 RepID=A0A7J0GZK9_9ERIC|nr:phosphorylase superfamily protein [Actinidia rufa]
MEEVFWLPVKPKWLRLASQLVDLKLLRCVNETDCLPETPKVVHGLRGSTADIFLDNATYRKFLFNEFNVSTVDEERSAILMVGGGEKLKIASGLSSLAAVNALSVAVEFIGLIGLADPTQDH